LDEDKTLPDNTIYKTKTSGGYQVLGLMTKAAKPDRVNFYTNEEVDEEERKLAEVEIPYDYISPSGEDYLVKHTLWPEINKMYGHGFEIQSIATTRQGDLIVSSCFSQTTKHSNILIWDPSTYQIKQELEGHEFTVLQLQFSTCDKWLISVSRDRCIGVWERDTSSDTFIKRSL
jgi:elongator complex protein 2